MTDKLPNPNLTPNPNQVIAYSYVRFSTKQQSSGTSLERQLKASQLYCATHGLTLSDKGYHDLGVSGFKSVKRPELEEMLIAIKDGTIAKGSYILIEAIDRLSRKGISVTQDVLKQILQHDIKVAFVGEDAKTLMNMTLTKDSLNDLSSVILVALAADLAHKESLRKSKLVKAAKAISRDKASKGENQRGQKPFWLTFNEDTKKFEINERVSVIKEIIELRLTGMGPRKICKVLNDKSIESPRGNQWNHVTVTYLLRSPSIYGAYQTHIVIDGKHVPDVLIENYYPKIVDYSVYLQLKADLKTISKGSVSKANPFAGVLKCSCGSAMQFNLKKDNRNPEKPRTYETHYCIKSVEGRCEHKKRIKDLVPLLTSIMDKLTITKVVNTNNIELEIRAKDEKIQQLTNMLLELDNPPLSIMKAISNLESERDALLKQDTPEVSQDDVVKLSEIQDHNEYNMLLKRVVQRIIIHQLDDSGKNLRVEVLKTDKHKQNFLVNNGRVLFKSDTKKLKDLLESFKENGEF